MTVSGLRILVAEDEFLVALSIEELLGTLGCDVVGPFAAIEAVSRAAVSERLDGALLDINLRGETVFSAAETLFDNGVPIVFCSGYADISMLPAKLRSCPRLSKPYTDVQLQKAIETHFRPAGCDDDAAH